MKECKHENGAYLYSSFLICNECEEILSDGADASDIRVPAPTDIADLVIQDIKKRKEMGRKKYGVPLRAKNGRDALQDLYEELIDATQYCKQEMIERDEPIEIAKALAYSVTKAVIAEYKKKSKNTLLVSFEGWIEKELKNASQK